MWRFHRLQFEPFFNPKISDYQVFLLQEYFQEHPLQKKMITDQDKKNVYEKYNIMSSLWVMITLRGCQNQCK